VVLRLSNAFFVSLMLHAGVVALLGLSRQLGGTIPEVEPLLDVDLVSLAPPPMAVPRLPPPAPVPEAAPEPAPAITLPNAQIVVPPDAGKAEPPKETRLLSDRDNTVEQQMVRRGEPDAGPDAPQAEPVEAPAGPAPPAKAPSRPDTAMTKGGAPPQMAKVPGLDALLPSASQLVREGYSGAGLEEPSRESDSAAQEKRNVLRYTDAARTGSGRRGTFDFLPDVREGDVTLLNTKAEMFAPFVRRVAQRVFQNQIISLRRELSRVAASSQETVSVEAIMNRRGQLVSVRVTDQSATSTASLDRHLLRACQHAFFDLNPPPDAVSADGNIHFVFRTEVQIVAGPAGANYGALLMAGLL
jgi:hypothetical protein